MSRIMKALVADNDNAAATIRDQPIPASVAGGAFVSPQIQSAPNPHRIPMAWPKIVYLGLAVGAPGVWKRRKAVGPSDGKTNGVRVSMATMDKIPIVIKLLMNKNAALISRLGNRFISHE